MSVQFKDYYEILGVSREATKDEIQRGCNGRRTFGMPNPKGLRGDLYVEIKIKVPKKLSKKEQQLFEELKKVSSFDPR
jgi:DnaJ-class molecular chaperone